MRGRATTICGNLRSRIRPGQDRFLTLTTRHNNNPLPEQIKRLYHSFGLLRRRCAWKQHVAGGCAFLEVKLSERDGRWHPHLHCIITGEFFSQKLISEEWYAVTGDSTIVDIRPIEGENDIAHYVTKYLTKPIDSSIINQPDKFDEAVMAFRGLRQCLTFGSWRGLKLTEVKDDGHAWSTIGLVDYLLVKEREGEPNAARYCQAARRKWKMFPSPLPALCNADGP